MKTESGSLSLTSDYFKILVDLLHETFTAKHNLSKLPKTYQLYGYGIYDENKPSLQQDFEQIGGESINGKYLYDKTRELSKGKPTIKLNAHYKAVILLYIGYEDFQKFIEDHTQSKDEKEKQLALISDESVDKTFYYINYYFGEDNVILKGKTIISDNWRKIKHVFIYPLEDGSLRDHYNYGTIIRREDTLHIHSKTLLDGKLVQGASEIYYIGHKSPSNVNFLVGTYCTFDIYTNTVAGQSILERCESKEDMEEKSKSPNIPPYIAMEIRNKRIINERVVPNSHLELSENSPYSSIYNSLAGTYEFTFEFPDGFKEILKFKILPSNYKIVALSENVYFEKDAFNLMNKGSIVHFSFDFAGIVAFDRVDIYFKTYYLKEDSEVQNGVFSGIDCENRLVKGEVGIRFAKT